MSLSSRAESRPAPDFDVLIVGGGPVGASLAAALARSPFRVGVIEARALEPNARPGDDDRTIALNHGSERILRAIGAWEQIAPADLSPIQSIHISDQGRPGLTRLDAAQAGVEALGYVVQIPALASALVRSLSATANVRLIAPATVEAVDVDVDLARVSVKGENGEQIFTSRLVVGADGTRSRLRELLALPARARDYGQTAVVSNVTCALPHNNVAFERFTPTGPLAFLPMQGHRCAVVWSVRPEQAQALLALAPEAFRDRLQAAFGDRLGPIGHVGARQAFPLGLTRVTEPVRPRVVLLGNAAHTLHPVAGQGLNLGLRDVAVLAEVLNDGHARGEDIGGLALLERYLAWRRRDTLATAGFTDGLIRVFSNNFLPLVVGRNLGLLAVDLLPGIKRGLLHRTMGLAGRLPRLMRGLPL